MSTLAAIAETLGIWNWWVLAGVLLVLELLTGTFFFLWFGTAALAVGILMLFFGWGWRVQVTIFAVLSLILLGGSRFLIRRTSEEGEETFLNRRAARHVGRVFTLDQPIVGGRGRVKIDDTIWLVSGPDSPEKARVKVTGVDGATLLVEPAEASAEPL